MFLPLQIGFVSSCYVSLLPVFILCGRGYGLLGFPYFLLSFFRFCFLSPSRFFCLWPCLISSYISCYVCHFLLFDFFFLHAVPFANHSLFLSIIFFHISFHSYPFIQKDFAIKRVLDPICLILPKSFYWRFVFCNKSVFCCRSLSHAFLFQPRHKSTLWFLFCFLFAFLALWSSWWTFGLCFVLGFLPHELMGTNLQKRASTPTR